MILYEDQQPIYLTLMTSALYERYEAQFDCDTDWQTGACKEEFAAYLQNNPGAALRVLLGWQSNLKSRALYHRFYQRRADPFSFGEGDYDRLVPFIEDATDVFIKFNANSLESVLRQYPDRLVSVPPSRGGSVLMLNHILTASLQELCIEAERISLLDEPDREEAILELLQEIQFKQELLVWRESEEEDYEDDNTMDLADEFDDYDYERTDDFPSY